MQPFRRMLLLGSLKVSDALILTASLLFSSQLTTRAVGEFTFGELLSTPINLKTLATFFLLIPLWYLLFRHLNLYRSRRFGKRLEEWKDIFLATTMGTCIVAFGGIVLGITTVTPSFLAVFLASSTLGTVAFRSVLRFFLKRVRLSGRNLRNILVVGTNKKAYQFAYMIEAEKDLGYQLLGFIDEKVHLPNPSVRLLGAMKDFPALIRNRVVDEVFISLPIKSYYEEILGIVKKAEEQGIMVRYVSELFDAKIGQSRVEVFEHFPILTISSGPQEGWEYLAKHFLDKALALMLLIMTAPLMIAAIIAIKLTTPGPAFFVQKRVGRNKRIFRLYKFRTMVVTAEKHQVDLEQLNDMDGPVFKLKNDPRITKVGKYLRKWSIDELPQLFNVLAGDMSLVGPRPLPVRDFQGFGDDWRRRRLSVRPGITCTWQINGRNSLPFEEWMRLDMEYIENWRLWTDIKILLRTIPEVLRGGGI